jgi:hypothetical protein
MKKQAMRLSLTDDRLPWIRKNPARINAPQNAGYGMITVAMEAAIRRSASAIELTKETARTAVLEKDLTSVWAVERGQQNSVG